ncbi:membrane dipeptidase [Sabulibacter ruber]|uniref:membrane dipeptidase n=1 Tax=Sabulibacter ruber TaxID=2811901 RepID=UPI001A96A15C|nr:membrane dipeptidase [Sabulibacter ruber]
MEKLFDFHFHLLFKHYIGVDAQKGVLALDEDLKTSGVANLLNDLLGGPFDSQSSPSKVKRSLLSLGVTGILSVEHAFANRILQVVGLDFSSILPLKTSVFEEVRAGKTSYYQQFKDQVGFHLQKETELRNSFQIGFLKRSDWAGKSSQEIAAELGAENITWLAFSIEGGHNLSDAPIRKGIPSRNPERQLLEIQDREDIDFISINLCHLSFIPEQPLGGFAQGMTRIAQIAFKSEDFMPKFGLGLTELGKKVIAQALTHTTKPVLIDVKHMSLYTRLDFYQYREQLILQHPEVERLPIISSHTGFTFTSAAEYLEQQRFRSSTALASGLPVSKVEPENRRIGRTNDLVNRGLFANPWTINLFDEEIAEIMQSGGMIGLSLDQRILGATNPAADSLRDRYYEGEYVAYPEWERLFRDGKLPGEEKEEARRSLVPSKQERHSMLLCLHLVHAARVGYANQNWLEGTSPWDHLCIGSDFDGLINPINGFEDVTRLGRLRSQLMTYLPQADKYLLPHAHLKVLRYNPDGTVNRAFLEQVIDAFLYQNGHRFIIRYLLNWKSAGLPV